MADLDNQSVKDNVNLSLDSSSEENNTQINHNNEVKLDWIDMSIDCLNVIKTRLNEMEDYQKLRALQLQVDQELENILVFSSRNSSNESPCDSLTGQEKSEVDARSVYVGNVDYSVTATELQAHFNDCGLINRVTILCNKFDGHPKGYAYIEFVDVDSVVMAIDKNNSLLKGRLIKVSPKRTNKPGFSTTNWPATFKSRSRHQSRSELPDYVQSSSHGGYKPIRPRVHHFKKSTFYPY